MPFTTPFTLISSPASLLFGAPKKNSKAGLSARVRLVGDVVPGLEHSLSMFQEARHAFKKMRSRCAAVPVSLSVEYAEVGEVVECYVHEVVEEVVDTPMEAPAPTIDIMALLHQDLDDMILDLQVISESASTFDDDSSFVSEAEPNGKKVLAENGELEFQMEMLLAEMWTGEDVDLGMEDELEMLQV
ncbi:hypothetical protein OF83DRAFT_1080724 [Amylostereum chailletii]|nr:hypothetical protein OF83DRAFT_1080724 [Amylostereum chailletii]